MYRCCGGGGIRTHEACAARFPSVCHEPLGDASWVPGVYFTILKSSRWRGFAAHARFCLLLRFLKVKFANPTDQDQE